MNAAPLVFITGASSGIGQALAVELARRGTHLSLTDIDTDGLARTVADCEGRGVKVTSRRLDVADRDAIYESADSVPAEHGHINMLFNNAGVFTAGLPIDELPVEAWRDAVDVNLTGAFLCTREAFRLMKKQSPRGGRIGPGPLIFPGLSAFLPSFLPPGRQALLPPCLRAFIPSSTQTRFTSRISSATSS